MCRRKQTAIALQRLMQQSPTLRASTPQHHHHRRGGCAKTPRFFLSLAHPRDEHLLHDDAGDRQQHRHERAEPPAAAAVEEDDEHSCCCWRGGVARACVRRVCVFARTLRHRRWRRVCSPLDRCNLRLRYDGKLEIMQMHSRLSGLDEARWMSDRSWAAVWCDSCCSRTVAVSKTAHVFDPIACVVSAAQFESIEYQQRFYEITVV